MPRISMLIPEEALKLIDKVSDNRTAFMIDAAVREARKRRRELLDAEVAQICSTTATRDSELSTEFDNALFDGLAHLPPTE